MRSCKKSALYDPIWLRLAPLALLAMFVPVRPFLALFGPAWPHLALLGHSSIFISRYIKLWIRQGVTQVTTSLKTILTRLMNIQTILMTILIILNTNTNLVLKPF